jgi:hypothetical protein
MWLHHALLVSELLQPPACYITYKVAASLTASKNHVTLTVKILVTIRVGVAQGIFLAVVIRTAF